MRRPGSRSGLDLEARVGGSPPEIRTELEAHIEGSVDLLMARGWSEADARREVERRFGDADRHIAGLERRARRRVRRRRLRGAWSLVVTALGGAVREVGRFRGLAASVVAVLGIGIGVNGATFQVVDRLLLTAPPRIEDPSGIRRLHQTVRDRSGAPHVIDAFTYRDVEALRATSGARIAAVVQSMPETLGAGADAVRVRVSRVDSAWLPLLGVRAILGRSFVSDDHTESATPVALLGHGLWTARFGGDPAVIGRVIRLGRGEYAVIGVLPKGFMGAQAPATDVWVPLESAAVPLWGTGWRNNTDILAFRILARLPTGMRGDAYTWAARFGPLLRRSRSPDEPFSDLVRLHTSTLVPASAPDPGSVIAVSRWVAGMSLLVLLVACANVANLFLAHGERVRRATAVRMALGATSARLGLDLLARAVLLALLAGAVAALFAFWGGSVLERLFVSGLEMPGRPDTGRLIVFTGGTAVLAGLLTGILPALRGAGSDVRGVLERGGRITGATGRLRHLLVAAQVALSMLLLVGAGLFITSLRRAVDVDLGFESGSLLMVRLEREADAERPRAALYEDAERQLSGFPGIAAVSPTVGVPFVILYGLSGGLPGQPDLPRLSINAVGPAYFRTLGTGVVRGREFQPADLREGAPPVAVVGERAAVRLWPRQDPLGRCLRVGPADGPCTRVVGIAPEHAGESTSPGDLLDAQALQAWIAMGHPAAAPPSALLVRTTGAPDALAGALRRTLSTLPGVRYVETGAIADFVAHELRAWRLGATVFSLFGAIAVAVAAIGVYGVLAFEVAQRRREYGIRLALGAGRLRVMGPVVRAALPIIAGGMACGALTAAACAARLHTMLFGVAPLEPRIFAAAAAVLLLAACGALFVPAWRAGGVEAREALAAE